MEEKYFVYITTNKYNQVLYTGSTKNLIRRATEHKYHLSQGFSSWYNATKLVYFEEVPTLEAALKREKQIKSWSRVKKLKLIWSKNLLMKDLSSIL
ncbi:GIY-YIG nuclease family protein [Patescibacteria group bacterium]|nr:GIY-YIG nuclease family protein [Patescibacteria group bacterium]